MSSRLGIGRTADDLWALLSTIRESERPSDRLVRQLGVGIVGRCQPAPTGAIAFLKGPGIQWDEVGHSHQRTLRLRNRHVWFGKSVNSSDHATTPRREEGPAQRYPVREGSRAGQPSAEIGETGRSATPWWHTADAANSVAVLLIHRRSTVCGLSRAARPLFGWVAAQHPTPMCDGPSAGEGAQFRVSSLSCHGLLRGVMRAAPCLLTTCFKTTHARTEPY